MAEQIAEIDLSLLELSDELASGDVLRITTPYPSMAAKTKVAEVLIFGTQQVGRKLFVDHIPLDGHRQYAQRHALPISAFGIGDRPSRQTDTHSVRIGRGYPLEVDPGIGEVDDNGDELWRKVVGALVAHSMLPESDSFTDLYRTYFRQ